MEGPSQGFPYEVAGGAESLSMNVSSAQTCVSKCTFPPCPFCKQIAYSFPAGLSGWHCFICFALFYEMGNSCSPGCPKTHCEAEAGNFQLVILPPLPSKCWVHRNIWSRPVYSVLGIEHRTLSIRGTRSTQCATPAQLLSFELCLIL